MTKDKRRKKRKARSGASSITLRRRLGLYYWRLAFSAKITTVIFLILFFFTNLFASTKESIGAFIYNKTADGGLVLNNVVIQGQKNTPSQEIIEAIGTKRGAPILSIPIATVQQTLENNTWIKSCIVERRLPDTLYIALFERKPIAIWQFNKKLYLIDDVGDRISSQQIENFPNLLHVVGEGANLYAKSLLDDLAKVQDLSKKVKTAVRYGNRRWNIILDENITVKMPEEDFDKAYKYLQKINKGGKLFGNRIKTLDLRLPDRYYYEKNKL